ncbi:MAG: hypothetical protein J7M11_03755 [Elusimicrobia bacterium]|nr:hypothetical protein [Elusimicrobiota bacterium]
MIHLNVLPPDIVFVLMFLYSVIETDPSAAFPNGLNVNCAAVPVPDVLVRL